MVLHCMIWYLILSILQCFCVFSFVARAVSRKTPIPLIVLMVRWKSWLGRTACLCSSKNCWSFFLFNAISSSAFLPYQLFHHDHHHCHSSALLFSSSSPSIFILCNNKPTTAIIMIKVDILQKRQFDKIGQSQDISPSVPCAPRDAFHYNVSSLGWNSVYIDRCHVVKSLL